MNTTTHTYGRTLVVLEGHRRLRWSSALSGRPSPVGLWPDVDQLDDVRGRIATGRPLLIILDHTNDVVPLLPEEVDDVPAGLARLVEGHGHAAGLSVPLLDWLPGELSARGISFLRAGVAHRAATPRVLLPELLVEDGDEPVRFACRMTNGPLPGHTLAALTDRLFGSLTGTTAP